MELYDPQANATVADINTVPTDFRFMYKDNGGGAHVLDAENPAVQSSMRVFSSLKGALSRARTDARTAKEGKIDLTPLSEYGSTPADILAAFQQKTTDLSNQIKSVNVEKLKESIGKEFEPKITAATQRAKALEAQLYQTLVVGEAAAAIADAKGIPELITPFIQQLVKVAEIDGKFVVQVVDGAGEVRYSGAAPMGIKELVAEMKTNARYARLFESEAPNGGGANGKNQQQQQRPGAPRQQAPVNNGQGDQRSPTAKIAAGLSQMGKR